MTTLLLMLCKPFRFLPLPVLRVLGAVLGWLLYALMQDRRHTVRVNLLLCFPALSSKEREAQVREVFVFFMQSWLDRFWLWHSPEALLIQRLRIVAVGGSSGTRIQGGGFAGSALDNTAPSIIFAPHFVGLDAGWTALNRLTKRHYATIYAAQKNQAVDQWVRTGRERCSNGAAPLLIDHHAGVRPIIQAIRKGEPLYLLPDMNYEPLDSLFVPFFGVPAATLPVLPRYAKLGKAKVVPVVTRMTKSGYDIEIYPAWDNYPSGDSEADVAADTLRMNRELECYVATMPTQYYWVHRRFKDQPNGHSSPYEFS
jgi:Kdo2-lipid IVA lauroyltransferase/acyltransferase